MKRSAVLQSRWHAALTVVVAIAAAGCAHSADVLPLGSGDVADLNGTWRVPWCDREAPEADCGGFTAHLVQRGDRLCGSYTGARVRLTQIDEGLDRAINGVVVGNTAVLTIESGRSGAIYMVRADLLGGDLYWNELSQIRPADRDIDILAGKEVLKRGSDISGSEWASGIAEGCGIVFDRAGLTSD